MPTASLQLKGELAAASLPLRRQARRPLLGNAFALAALERIRGLVVGFHLHGIYIRTASASSRTEMAGIPVVAGASTTGAGAAAASSAERRTSRLND